MAVGAKAAVQRRSQETRDKLISALESLLREKDFEAISVAEIAGRAGVSPASIYQRFKNKNAAVSILLELYVGRAEAWYRLPARQVDRAATSLRGMLVILGKTAWQQFDEQRHIMRPAYLNSRLHPEQLGAHWNEAAERGLVGFRSLLRSYPDEIGPRDVDRAAGMIAYFFNMMFLGRLLHDDLWSQWKLPTDADEFAEQLADFVGGYLSVPSG